MTTRSRPPSFKVLRQALQSTQHCTSSPRPQPTTNTGNDFGRHHMAPSSPRAPIQSLPLTDATAPAQLDESSSTSSLASAASLQSATDSAPSATAPPTASPPFSTTINVATATAAADPVLNLTLANADATALSAEEQASFASLRAGDVELSMISLKTHGPPPPGALRFHIGIPEIDIDAVFADMLRFATDCVNELTWALDAPPQRFRMVTANPSNADDDAVNVVLDLLPPPPPSSVSNSRNGSVASDQDEDSSQSDAQPDSGTMSFAVSLVGARAHISSSSPPPHASSSSTPALRSPRLSHPAPWNGMTASVPDMWHALQAQLTDANSVLRDPQSLMHRSTRAELVYTAPH